MVSSLVAFDASLIISRLAVAKTRPFNSFDLSSLRSMIMKLSTKLLVAALCIAIPTIAYHKVMGCLFPEGRGFDIWPEAQYRVEGTDYMEYQDLRFAVNAERFSK